ncbi:hypothetical protein BDD12DRAFT_911482 [Trichophaea hybrida]|nr:hypothetical protein BDD12DRAFT_911482 [Trichophaea hybrida]
MARNLLEGLSRSQPIGIIRSSSVRSTINTPITQLDAVSLTSYDQLPIAGAAKSEIIVVPGSPAVWSPPPLPKRLQSDGVQPLIHENFPECPLEPLFRALENTQPDLDLNSYDIITDRRNLQMLLSFVSGTGRWQEFRLDAELVGNSVLFSRWIDWETRRHPGGYGTEFEKIFTKTPESVKGSLVHKRVVGYTLGGLRMMVRFKVDAHLEDAEEGEEEGEVEVIRGNKVVSRGVLAKDEGIVELRTAAMGTKYLTADKTLSQMWLSRTPVLCEGFHLNGEFKKVVVMKLQEQGKFLRWEEANQDRIGKLVRVIRMLKEMMERAEGERFAVISKKGSDNLEVYRLAPSYKFRLPKDLHEKWEEKQMEKQVDQQGLLETALERLSL